VRSFGIAQFQQAELINPVSKTPHPLLRQQGMANLFDGRVQCLVRRTRFDHHPHIPQTINGTATAVSSDAGFSVYTVEIALYNLIPTLQATAGSTITRLNIPATVTVYLDANAQLLNSFPLSTGSVLRFRVSFLTTMAICAWIATR
jgi:hypothetical protein